MCLEILTSKGNISGAAQKRQTTWEIFLMQILFSIKLKFKKNLGHWTHKSWRSFETFLFLVNSNSSSWLISAEGRGLMWLDIKNCSAIQLFRCFYFFTTLSEFQADQGRRSSVASSQFTTWSDCSWNWLRFPPEIDRGSGKLSMNW